MELRQLSYFLAVVDAGTISAASRTIHIAQPALTRQIRLLEQELDTTLLERHARGVYLTVTGQALVEEARELLARHDQIKARLSTLDNGLSGKLTLGITVTHLWVPQIANLLGAYRHHYRGVAFEVLPLLSGPQLERLRADRLDAGILYLDGEQQPGLETHLLQRDQLVLAVPSDSAWAHTPPADLKAVQDADFIWAFRHVSPLYHDRMEAHFRRHDFKPRVTQYGADNIAILSMVSAGLGVSVVPAASSHHPIPGVCFVHLPELDECDMSLWLAYKPDNSSPALANFITLARRFLPAPA